MILYAKIESERGKALEKTGNEYILTEYTVNREQVAQVEIYIYPDGEWLLKYRPYTSHKESEDTDWTILDQGNLPSNYNHGKNCTCPD